jgi:alkylation response protein AidB-like acyl-CoA dehydrogenase
METSRVMQGIQELLPAIRKRRDEIEKGRRMPRDLVDELRKTGVFRQTVRRAVGGDEASPLDVLRAIELVSSADGSAGWTVMIGTGCNVVSGYLEESGAREVFADPSAPMAGIAAPGGAATPVDGGFRVSGRWGFASGIHHCDWVWAGCLVTENGQPRMTAHGPEIVHVCLPVRNVEIHDTWYVSGLCGTGSNDFSAKDVFVPASRVFELIDPGRHRPEPLYQMPSLGLFVAQLVAVGLGIARGALDELAAIAQTKKPTLYQQPIADKAVAQVEIARAEGALGGARAFLFETVESIWDTVRAEKPPTPRQLALLRVAATRAAEVSSEVSREANILAGGSAIYSASAMQRHARDAEALTHHFTVAPHTWEEAGRVLLGRMPATPIF